MVAPYKVLSFLNLRYLTFEREAQKKEAAFLDSLLTLYVNWNFIKASRPTYLAPYLG